MSSQMLINDFLTKQNISLIWEVVMDDVLKYKPQEIVIKINHIFNANLNGFFENEKQKCRNLMELNKKYISLIINYIDENFSQKQQPQYKQTQQTQQTQHPQNPQNYEKELITHDDLQTDRMSQFDKKLNTIKQEFSTAMSLPVPEKPDFSDKLDTPLTELELEIKKVMAQRNYDIEQINRNNLEANTNSNTNTNTNTNWLKPQETSVKNEKVNPLQQKPFIKTPQQQQQQQQIKYIKIDHNDLNNEFIQNEVIDINKTEQKILSPKKQVSWNNNIEYENNFEDDFLKKLKTIKPQETQETQETQEIQFVTPTNNNNNNTNEIISIKEELKTFNVKIENLTQNVNLILELLKQQKL
jgi:hypothetical protein